MHFHSRLSALLGLFYLISPLLAAENSSYFNLNSAFGLLGSDLPAQLLDLPVGTCNAETPCVNGACCSSITGLCGYSPAECGAGNCTSNCDAKAECGQYGVPGRQTCPLGVCCSQFGFCGSVDDFCNVDKGCQSDFGGCGPVKRPSCSKTGNSVQGRSIGYYESWANTRPCGKVSPEDLNLDGLTHINFAFVFFDPVKFSIVPMDKNAGSLLSRFTALKERKPGLQTWVSVGGWSFNDPGPYQQAFSTMSSTAENRGIFIAELMYFMETYGFDGMDLDWEYPTADDRGGKAEDKANFVLLSKEIKEAFGKRYGYSITLPASYWYLQHFDLKNLQPHVDWFNLMSYDLHGTWDAASKFVGPYVATHTNITEIDLGLDLLWRAGVKPKNVVLGQGFYGRSFTLEDSKCNKPNGVCRFSGGAKEGPCSKASGILNLQEIMDIIKDKKLEPVHDEKSGTKWIHWDNDQWVSYDDGETLGQKAEFANSRCLGGLMVWALDQVAQDAASILNPDDMDEEALLEAEVIYQDEAAKGVCYTTKCGEKCRNGDHEATQTNGQPGMLSTMDRCPKDEFRSVCCSKGSIMGTCRWRGYRGLAMSCMGGCAEGEVSITENSNSRTDKEDQSCTGGTQTYCCLGFKPPISKEKITETIKDEATDAAIAAAEALALEVAAKAFCRIAIMAATAPLRFIPFVGKSSSRIIISIALQAAMPALVAVCSKGVAKAGKSVFKFQGKDYDVKLDKPLETKVDRGPSKPTSKAPDKPASCKGKRLEARVNLRNKDITRVITQGPARQEIVRRTCYGDTHGQACYHYKSVIDRDNKLSRLTCPGQKIGEALRPVVGSYNKQHNTDWSSGWLQQDNLVCQRDEYPPADIWRSRDDKAVWIRLLPQASNGGAGQLFGGCPEKQAEELIHEGFHTTENVGCRVVTITTRRVRAVEKVIELNFERMGGMPADYGIEENPCWPKTLNNNDPGFALLNNDDWYKGAGRAQQRGYRQYYSKAPTDMFTLDANGVVKVNIHKRGWTPPRKRKADEVKRREMDPLDIVVSEGNTTRQPTEEELLEDFGLVRCRDGSCEKEMYDLGYASLPVSGMKPTSPPETEASTTMAVALPTSLSGVLATAADVAKAAAAVITAAPEYDAEWV